MRLKTLRKDRPTFETEGAVVHGSRVDIANNDLRPVRQRSNNSFALPTSLHTESSSVAITPSNQLREINIESDQHVAIATEDQSTINTLPYQAIEAAYLEHGIRIRLSPTKVASSDQPSDKVPKNNLHRRTAFVSRLPSRTSSALQYAATTQDQYDDTRPFSVLQHASENDSERARIDTDQKSITQSSQVTEEPHVAPRSTPTPILPQCNQVIPSESISCANYMTTSNELFENDPDILYLSTLLQQPSGDSVRETIRRRAGLRGTFAVHRNPLVINSMKLEQKPREKSPATIRSSITRSTTINVAPTSSPQRLEQDIFKHVSRIRRTSQSKESVMRSPRVNTSPVNSSPTRTNTTPVANSPLRANHSINSYKRNTTSVSRSSKSFNLEPLEFSMSSIQQSKPVLYSELPSIRTPSAVNDLKSSIRGTKSAKIMPSQSSNMAHITARETSTLSSILRDESLLSLKTSTTIPARQSNSFDSGCYDRGSSIGDVQSLTSSSIVHINGSAPSARLNYSAARRSNSNKRVSFYDEPTAVILTTATYV